LDRSGAPIPGLKVVYPVTPADAKGMMNAALAGTDPVASLEPEGLRSGERRRGRRSSGTDRSQPSVKRR
jgi:pyruvate/2-oxoglutarate/acetoin dehydrogenase E1 component